MAPSDDLSAELADHKAQRERLRRFFLAHLDTVFTQETLAEACGAHVSSVRTRIGELKRGEGCEALPLRGHPGLSWVDADGVKHRGMKRWECLSYQPLGRDPQTPAPDQWPAFEAPIQETFRLTPPETR